VKSEDVESFRMPLVDHLIELRRRLLYCFFGLIALFIVCYYFSAEIYGVLVRPLADILEQKGGERRMIFTQLTEAFLTYVKVAFFAAMFLGFPLIAVQVWKFVAPGLYRNEKEVFLPFLIATPVLFFTGGAFAYFVVFPLAWQFFLGFEIGGDAGQLPIQLEAKVGEYLTLVMQLLFAFGLCFELPVVLTLLARAGMMTAEDMRQKRRYAIVIAFVLAAVLTPPDAISQIALAIPMIILYEASIFAVRLVERRATRRTDESESSPAAAATSDEGGV
jgi:sec-independent protein translocase protein TatC